MHARVYNAKASHHGPAARRRAVAPLQIAEADIRTLFEPCGAVVDVKLPTKTTADGHQQLRGFGFVEFSASRSGAGAGRNRA